MIETVGSIWMWVGFTAFVLGMLAVDLGVVSRKAHAVRLREALIWVSVVFALALAFNVYIYKSFGPKSGLEFLTGYLIEQALSIDNLFVFVIIFRYFAVKPEFQHRVLFWGILGALVLRMVFILAGAVLITRFAWIIYIFGAFLIYTGIKILITKDKEIHPDKNPVLKLFRRVMPMTTDYRDKRFFVREAGRLLATPLLLVLVFVESTDVVFAVDSIPAIFAVTRDPFIVYTSNIFAILCLRSLYFVLASVIDRFHYLHYGLGLILAFVGVKMCIAEWYHIPIGLSLGVVVGLLAGSMILSVLRPRRPADGD